MTKGSKNSESCLLDFIEEGVLELTSEDLKGEYHSNDLENTDDFTTTRSLIDSALSTRKVSELKIARDALDSLRKIEGDRKVELTIEDAKGFIIQLMASGRLPNELTLAFREGEDIPDSEIESILDDLRELGFDLGDE